MLNYFVVGNGITFEMIDWYVVSNSSDHFEMELNTCNILNLPMTSFSNYYTHFNLHSFFNIKSTNK